MLHFNNFSSFVPASQFYNPVPDIKKRQRFKIYDTQRHSISLQSLQVSYKQFNFLLRYGAVNRGIIGVFLSIASIQSDIPNFTLHISKCICAMYMKLLETTQELNVYECLKFHTSISFFNVRKRISKLRSGHENTNLEPFSIFHASYLKRYLRYKYETFRYYRRFPCLCISDISDLNIFFLMSDIGSQNWDPGAQNTN